MRKALIRLLILGNLFLLMVLPSKGQSFGIRAGRYTDVKEYFVGVELLSRVSGQVFFNPNVEYVFVKGMTYMTFNFDFHLDFPTGSPLFFWLGGGLGILYTNVEGPAEGKTDLGPNFLFGVGIKTYSPLVPYFQVKLFLADKNEFVIGVGLRF